MDEFQLFYFLLGGAVLIVLFLMRFIREPRLALYLSVFTAPITWGLGSGSILNRLTISDILGALFILACLMNRSGIARAKVSLSSPLHRFVGFFLLILGLSLLANLLRYEEIINGIVEFAVALYLVIFYFFFIRVVTNDEEVERILTVMLFAAAYVVGIGLWDSLGHRVLGLPYIIGPLLEWDQYRVAATFREQGQLGVYLLSMFFIALASYFQQNLSKRKRFGIIVLLVGIVLLSLFASRRSAYVALLVGVFAFFVLKVRNPRVLIPAVVMLAASFLAVTIFLRSDEDFSAYFQKRTAVINMEGVTESDFIMTQWRNIFAAFAENPILGVGIGGFLDGKYDETGHEVHSTYGQLIAETGVMGVIAYGLFMATLVRLVYATGFKLQNPKWSVFCSVLFPAFAGFVVSYAYNRHLRERIFWVLVGLIVCTHRIARMRLRQRRLINSRQILAVQND